MNLKTRHLVLARPDTLYMDARILLLVVPEVEVGSVVGFEWVLERTPTAVEDSFACQGEFPVVRATYTLILPPRWEPDFSWVNWAPLEPLPPITTPASRPSPSIILDIPAIEDEPYRPGEQALAGRLLVRLKSPDAERPASVPSGWADMGAWYAELSEPQRVPDVSVAQKARELTAAAPDTLSKIRALAEFAQKEIRYVSIQIGIGGFQPHPAPSVLANRYGDCKDKATLLAALLKAVGIDSHFIVINTDRGGVNLQSPVSLGSFNHVILAIRLPDDVPGRRARQPGPPSEPGPAARLRPDHADDAARAPALLPPGQHGPARGRRERRAPVPPPSGPRRQRPRPQGPTRL